MKIIYIANLRIPTEKAYGYQIAKICEELSGLGVGVELWAPTRKNEIQKDLFDFYGLKRVFPVRFISCPDFLTGARLLGRGGFYLQGVAFFARLLFERSEKGSWVMTRNPEIAWLFHLKGYKIAYYGHFWPEGKNILFRFFLRGADAVICNSRGTAEAFKKRGFSNVAVIQNGVDLEDFSFKEGKEELRKGLSLPPEKKIALYAGHLYAWKGTDILFEAAERLKDSSNTVLVIVGGTPADHEKYVREAQEKGLTNVLLIGHQQKSLIPSYLCSADVLLLSNAPLSTESIRYTSPIKMFEYMASGVPIVASDLPSIREVLNEENSLLVEAGNAKTLTEGIKKILTDTELARRISDKARRDVSRFTWRSRAEDIRAFLEKT
ncbi:MAG: glycosyltransferase family 4 protein [Patescibacteria group bacterium]|nr:glycosyltransferase family 4 protein [Patescibacteria group bacterium]